MVLGCLNLIIILALQAELTPEPGVLCKLQMANLPKTSLLCILIVDIIVLWWIQYYYASLSVTTGQAETEICLATAEFELATSGMLAQSLPTELYGLDSGIYYNDKWSKGKQ